MSNKFDKKVMPHFAAGVDKLKDLVRNVHQDDNEILDITLHMTGNVITIDVRGNKISGSFHGFTDDGFVADSESLSKAVNHLHDYGWKNAQIANILSIDKHTVTEILKCNKKDCD